MNRKWLEGILSKEISGRVVKLTVVKERLGGCRLPHFFLILKIKSESEGSIYYRFDRFNTVDQLGWVDAEDKAINCNSLKAIRCLPEILAQVHFTATVRAIPVISDLRKLCLSRPFNKHSTNCLWITGEFFRNCLLTYGKQSEEGLRDGFFHFDDFVLEKMRTLRQQACLWLACSRVVGDTKFWYGESWMTHVIVTPKTIEMIQQDLFSRYPELRATFEASTAELKKELEKEEQESKVRQQRLAELTRLRALVSKDEKTVQ